MALIKDLTVFGTSRFISDLYGNTTYANKYITNGGTSSQFVKGDGSLDSSQYATTSILTSYVKKVTSTDNAVVRFDGTGGNVQNSGVTINDSNHLTAVKLITSGGTSSQFVKGDGSLDSNQYLKTTISTQTVVKGVGSASSSFSNFAPVKYVELKSNAEELDSTFLSSFQTNASPTTYTSTNTSSATATSISTSITGTTTCVAYVKTT